MNISRVDAHVCPVSKSAGEKRKEIKEAHPDWGIGEIGKETGRLWGLLSDAQKKPYNEQAAKVWQYKKHGVVHAREAVCVEKRVSAGPARSFHNGRRMLKVVLRSTVRPNTLMLRLWRQWLWSLLYQVACQ